MSKLREKRAELYNEISELLNKTECDIFKQEALDVTKNIMDNLLLYGEKVTGFQIVEDVVPHYTLHRAYEHFYGDIMLLHLPGVTHRDSDKLPNTVRKYLLETELVEVELDQGVIKNSLLGSGWRL